MALALQDPGILRWTAGTAVISTPADKRDMAAMGKANEISYRPPGVNVGPEE